ncbi:hypothetical protein GCM10018980_20670 [Streptomyces capoamus]|uniref:Uncharacterized protein n=1 Tax=Streptomyces capoamus TaxID=68183 RepID=A0A919C3W1_9ACTN|nr:hypothetical protein GCM10010501_03210 [Streptomyces libani subsp. rufus]GHG43673.1 hypothetical protein GCM10018980_20670 [Streptomyces capoamus]
MVLEEGGAIPRVPGGGRYGGGRAGAGRPGCQRGVTGIRCRPRSGHRTGEDTRITSVRAGGTTTAVRSRTARLPSIVTAHGARRRGAVCGARYVASLGRRPAVGVPVFTRAPNSARVNPCTGGQPQLSYVQRRLLAALLRRARHTGLYSARPDTRARVFRRDTGHVTTR